MHDASFASRRNLMNSPGWAPRSGNSGPAGDDTLGTGSGRRRSPIVAASGGIMTKGRHFEFEGHHRLDSAERRQKHPPEPLLELLAASAPARIADIGAGTGYFALPLAARLPAARVLCLDTEARMLELIERRASEAGLADRVTTVHMPDPSRLPLDDGVLSAAFMVNLYHELDDRVAYLGEVHRALADGGRLVICDWSPDGDGSHGPRVQHRVAVATACQELAAAGLVGVGEHRLYADLWVLEARRPG
jgi:SAM-dependent methyltransferase